mmetsp:Transcript_33969/g.77625  ORF Transcript_33969/g.77625 Transcript_33969/m.77625 type:complete len:233 (+) Transcript_33969:1446-2144(+)
MCLYARAFDTVARAAMNLNLSRESSSPRTLSRVSHLLQRLINVQVKIVTTPNMALPGGQPHRPSSPRNFIISREDKKLGGKTYSETRDRCSMVELSLSRMHCPFSRSMWSTSPSTLVKIAEFCAERSCMLRRCRSVRALSTWCWSCRSSVASSRILKSWWRRVRSIGLKPVAFSTRAELGDTCIACTISLISVEISSINGNEAPTIASMIEYMMYDKSNSDRTTDRGFLILS